MARLLRPLLLVLLQRFVECRQGTEAFLFPVATWQDRQPARSSAVQAVKATPASTASPASGGLFAGGSATVAAAVALLTLIRRSKVVRRIKGIREEKGYTYERKWWSVEETRDPTTLPLWQRDYRYGYQVLKRSMVENRKKGKKIFWECRVTKLKERGCEIEMLISGLPGWCPISQEGANGARLAVGDVVQMECTMCPQKRVNSEKKTSPWPQERRRFKAVPMFSHWNWIEQQNARAKAKELKRGDIVDGVVYKQIGRGLVITLPGENEPKGMLSMIDISRKTCAPFWIAKMFPPGTPVRCYVIHADEDNGRITLSTKEFEDDDHVGWMTSFPERCFKRAEEAVERYEEKRTKYIEWLQR